MANSQQADVHVTVGETFTVARVGEKAVAVAWGKSGDGAFYVTAGRGPAQEFRTLAEAQSVVLRIAVNSSGGGAASISQSVEV